MDTIKLSYIVGSGLGMIKLMDGFIFILTGKSAKDTPDAYIV